MTRDVVLEEETIKIIEGMKFGAENIESTVAQICSA